MLPLITKVNLNSAIPIRLDYVLIMHQRADYILGLTNRCLQANNLTNTNIYVTLLHTLVHILFQISFYLLFRTEVGRHLLTN